MSEAPSDAVPRTSSEPGFRDAVTFAFGDPEARLYGLARVALGGGVSGTSAFAIVYANDEVAAAAAQSDVPAADPHSWEDVAAAGVRCSVLAPLERWEVGLDDSDAALELRFEALSSPATLDAGSPLGRAGGMEGYEQLCRVAGKVRAGGAERTVRCLGQRSRLWGSPEWGRIGLARALTVWLEPDRAVSLSAVRPAHAGNHHEEAVAAFVFEDGAPRAVFDPRLSTTYDGQMRQRRAGLELWMDQEAEFARRAAGEAVCGTTLDVGEMQLQSAFFAWRMEGREGVGRYDVLRRGAGGDRGGEPGDQKAPAGRGRGRRRSAR